MNSDTILGFFKEITRIPRESGHEGPMTEFLQDFAAKRSLECRVDKTGNVVIVKPASPGKENISTVVLQAHQDMVCEKVNSFDFDFLTQPIPYIIEDGWMIARNTTLGADDGIGIAACLAVLDSDRPTGKVECLFTISEETGMDGAFALEKGFITGKTLINLDSEDEGQLFVGCAGGLDTTARFKFSHEPLAQGSRTMKLCIAGGIGGHSGDDIDKRRMNALAELGRFLFTQLQYDWQLISIGGGNKPNAICREAEAVITVPSDEFEDMAEDFTAFGEILRSEYGSADPDIFTTASAVNTSKRPIAEADTVRIISAIVSCPHGVIQMSRDIPGLVQTSTNLAAAKIEGDTLTLITNQRSSVRSELLATAQKVEAALLLGGFDVEHHGEYPGWKPNMDSKILSVCVESYRRLFGEDPLVKAIHAGLECGLFLEKFPDLDMISFGPTMRGVHAPGEKLELASLDRFTALLDDVLTNFE